MDYVAEVRQKFDKLAAKRGLTYASSTQNRVTYSKSDRHLDVQWYNWRSHGLDVIFRARLSDGAERTLHLYDVLRVRCPEKVSKVEGYEAAEDEPVRVGLEYLASLTDQFADEILAGDEAGFLLAENARDAKLRDLIDQSLVDSARKRAERAWLLKDFNAVAAELETVRDRLSRRETKMLEYARRRMKLNP